jgi:hypothetical protein
MGVGQVIRPKLDSPNMVHCGQDRKVAALGLSNHESTWASVRVFDIEHLSSVARSHYRPMLTKLSNARRELAGRAGSGIRWRNW